MKKIVSILMGMSVLFGCASHQDFEASGDSSQAITSIQQVHWHEVSIPSSFSIHISDRTQYLDSKTISGPVTGFLFNVTEPKLTIEVSGIVKGLKVFAPNLALYDQDFNLLRNYSSEHFDYDKDDFIKGDVLFGDVELDLPLDIKKVYGVIYTTESDLKENTQLLHPAKAMAIAKRNVPPAIDDPIAKHVDFGEVRVSIKRESIFLGLTSPSKSASAPEIPTSLEKSKIVKNVQPETINFYHQAIKSSVLEGNIPKALTLLDEAKELGIEGAQEVFVKAVNTK
ncbi:MULTISPECIES: MalM family protein [Vibrio]|uniref:MalM family protein n=1 Tax=Vibrio TaxID=662 RepID=UPI000C00041F|nr:MalM family protein [Vibrio sp. PID17_43]PHJ42936.1 maltose-binding protein [Vibrio sp. PID17_43]